MNIIQSKDGFIPSHVRCPDGSINPVVGFDTDIKQYFVFINGAKCFINGDDYIPVDDVYISDLCYDAVMDYLTDGNPDGDFKHSTIGADDNINWMIAGYKKALNDLLCKS